MTMCQIMGITEGQKVLFLYLHLESLSKTQFCLIFAHLAYLINLKTFENCHISAKWPQVKNWKEICLQMMVFNNNKTKYHFYFYYILEHFDYFSNFEHKEHIFFKFAENGHILTKLLRKRHLLKKDTFQNIFLLINLLT